MITQILVTMVIGLTFIVVSMACFWLAVLMTIGLFAGCLSVIRKVIE